MSGRSEVNENRKGFLQLAIQEFHSNLDTSEGMFAGKIYRALRVTEVVSFKRIGRPVSQTAQIQLRPCMLQ